jgi:deazaflavin-dependent oxidoreductase (nitroreductase family)
MANATRLAPWTPAQERIGTVVVRVMTALNVGLYKLTGGWLGGRFPGGAPICLVTTHGRKSGAPRTIALLYLRDGDRIVVVGSKGGMSHHPAWYLNMRADPRCEVQIGSEHLTMRARTATAEERKALWPRLVAMYRDYDDYQQRTTREIPVVICEPA